jgi:type IV pilus assembly protein PilB
MRNPYDLDAIDAVRNVTGMRVEPVLAQEDRLANAIERTFSARAQANMDGYVERALEEFKPQDERARKATLTEEDTRPVVGLVNQILIDAIRMGASDIHIEPRADRVDLRYRIDGELHPIRTIPRASCRCSPPG